MFAPGHKYRISRRDFLKVAAAGTAGLALTGWPPSQTYAIQKYPHWAKVVVARDDAATEGPNINSPIVRSLLNEAINVLTEGGGWQSLFPSYKAGETVAIKVNCIARKMTTHWEIVEAIVDGLVGIGVQPNNIIVWDAHASTMKAPRYTLRNDPSGLRVMAEDQLNEPYDRSYPVSIKGETTYLSRILRNAVHLINAPILKEHFEAGITFALKNHVGWLDNPKKIFHDPPEAANLIHAFLGRGKPKQDCIAFVNSLPDIKNKTRLIVGDALFGIYQRGPGGSPQFTYNGLIVGTDPVACDHQARLIIDEERVKNGKPPTNPSHIEKAAALGLGTPINEIKVIPVQRKKEK